MQLLQDSKSVVSKALYHSLMGIKDGLKKQNDALRTAIAEALLRMDTPDGVEDAKLILGEIHRITTPTAVDTQEDCGCKDKKARQLAGH